MTKPKTYRPPEWWAMWNAKRSYRTQMNNARARRIEWLLSFSEWLMWWQTQLGPSWAELRGPAPGQFCMSRKGDKGPYALWNIECKTNKQNRDERVLEWGEDHQRAKLTEREAREILNSHLTHKEAAIKYDVSYTAIQQLRSGRTWKFLARDNSRYKIVPPGYKRDQTKNRVRS